MINDFGTGQYGVFIINDFTFLKTEGKRFNVKELVRGDTNQGGDFCSQSNITDH